MSEAVLTGHGEGQWVVVDSNRLASDELHDFLAASADNRAVLPDYVAMERFKPDRLDALQAGFSVLKRFSDQVVILKATGVISRLNPDDGDIRPRMTDDEQTGAFAEFCRLVDDAANGDEHIVDQLRQRAQWAQTQMDIVRAGTSDFPAGLKEFEAFFSPSDLKRLRRDESMSPAMVGSFSAAFGTLVGAVFEGAQGARPTLGSAQWSESFIVRNALCNAVYLCSVIRRGVTARNADKARNDVIDVILATYGLYFDGVMSDDRLTNAVHDEARFLLQADGVFLPGAYRQHAPRIRREGA